MKVLLCTPYGINPKVVQGGITIWAHNIVDYYQTLDSGVELVVVPFDRKIQKTTGSSLLSRAWGGITDYRNAVKNTRRRLVEARYDVLHLCTSASISLMKDLVVLKMAKKRGIKTVVHFHFGRIPELALQQKWEWKLLCRVIRLADVAITMDMKSFNTLRDSGFNHIHYLPNPLSLGIMQQIRQEAGNVNRENRKICFVGHVIPAKGVYEMVEACNNIDDIELKVVGKVTDGVRQKMALLAGEKLNLEFIGEVDHARLIHELLSTGVFVLPSYTEGFPNVILESMACGCSIVTTLVGAIPEMLDIASDEPCGLCCEPKDVEGLRRNIQYFLDQPDAARQYAKRAVTRVNELYAVEKVWEMLVKIWNENDRFEK